MSGFLENITALSRERAAQATAFRRQFERQIAVLPSPSRLNIPTAGIGVIAEYKRRSPALGCLSGSGDDFLVRLDDYARGKAAAISVVTEPSRFGGSMTMLALACDRLKASGIPVMRKDFLVDPIQLFEARAAGAAGALLIVRLIDDRTMRSMLDVAADLGLFILAEAFDLTDLQRLASVAVTGQLVGGLNCRDLDTLKVDIERLFELSAVFPPGIPRAAESGIGDVGTLQRLAEAGYQLALIGGALMKTTKPATVIRRWQAATRFDVVEFESG